MEGCLACALSVGRMHLPGGLIAETERWRVEHTVGPLGVGTLIVKSKRHVVHVADLSSHEAEELGPLIQKASAVVTKLTHPEQVYVTLWSHAGAEPGHIHWVMQPVTRAQMDHFDDYGPHLQVKMFDEGQIPPSDAVDAFAERARRQFDEPPTDT